jgi:hypothetical protein
MKFQRNEAGRPVHECGLVNDGYPDIPAPYLGEFQKNYGYEKPVEILHWEWRSDYGRWGALVRFADGWRGITAPRPAPI